MPELKKNNKKPATITNTEKAKSNSYINDLKNVKELFDSGVINEKEFNVIKQKIINKL